MGSCRGEGMIEMHNIYIPSRGEGFQKMTAGIEIKGEEKKGKGKKRRGQKKGKGEERKGAKKGKGGRKKGKRGREKGAKKGWGKFKKKKMEINGSALHLLVLLVKFLL